MYQPGSTLLAQFPISCLVIFFLSLNVDKFVCPVNTINEISVSATVSLVIRLDIFPCQHILYVICFAAISHEGSLLTKRDWHL